MPYDPSRITYLLQRYTSKTCTREELEELFTCIAEAGSDETLHRFMEDAYHEIRPGEELPEIDYEAVYSGIVGQTPSTSGTGDNAAGYDPAPDRSPRRLFPFRYAAAAAVLLILAGLLFFWPKNQHPTVIQPPQLAANDVAPGGNKAVLTLADGSTVTLDSLGNQVITRGNTSITQQHGQLVYGDQGTDAAMQYHKLSTPRGGQFKLTLPDGTRVWLNSASSLRYPTAFTGKQRVVELEGQGYFEVAENASQPFKVMVNTMEVRVLGTHFDIMAYKDEATVNTTLVKGSVQVKEGQALQLLKPGQQALMHHQNHAITVQEADVNKIIAWKNGLFVFNNMTLTAILREVARWYDVEIVYNTTPGTELYGGGISRNLNLSAVMELLEGAGHNHFIIEGRKIIVTP
ncbi:FecR family protein [Chitinophaga cymbidii]|uniref:Iron dicitrate transporter FecR n=1 Tax=Chitinophaga cymbidii TaxID=1096750 RepID=A0A512RGA6_9BACT|nr:FecR family protein [Chitinophaga cymbidii]GEP94730.1 hypothetical protein CCY01nite_09900 [Chitinophaga cymbidii]